MGGSTFHDYTGKDWRLPGGGLRWTQPLGKRLCIVDIDTRTLDQANQIRDANPLHWNKTDPVAAGMLNHYMYAAVHGYDYHFVRAQHVEDRAPYWAKPAALSRILKNYDVCISIDADAIFTHLNLPFEWLLNRWRIEPEQTSLAMALDPDKEYNRDSKGRLVTNAGFVVAQNLPRTHAMLADWGACPDLPVKYPGCDKWKKPWPAEQRAFADYIRYAFNDEHDVLEIPCAEANGYPGSDSKCDGEFVRHFWSHKSDLLKPGVADTMAQAVAGKAHADFLGRKEEVIVYDKIPVPTEHTEKSRHGRHGPRLSE